MKALFIDFDDSFTYNVVQELTEIGLEVSVLHWTDLTFEHEADLFVLGPGPGHPKDYESIFGIVQSWLDQKKKIFAVCLGHQILGLLRRYQVVPSAYPLHGQKVTLHLNKNWQSYFELPGEVLVQRYNSLAVIGEDEAEGIENHREMGEIVISKGPHFISYQFHPESVGTNCRASFFRVILTHLL